MLMPRIINGAVFEIKWEKLPCINGDVRMPTTPEKFLGYTPSGLKLIENVIAIR